MNFVANILIGLVALLHIGFLMLEMFFWDHPFGRRTFRMTPEYSKASASLAANQGLYNGFLAAGLVWGLVTGDFVFKAFFLVCLLIAGIFDFSFEIGEGFDNTVNSIKIQSDGKI